MHFDMLDDFFLDSDDLDNQQIDNSNIDSSSQEESYEINKIACEVHNELLVFLEKQKNESKSKRKILSLFRVTRV